MKIRYSLTLICAIFGSTHVSAEELSIQSRFPPLQFNGSTPGGAHPVGGAANNFVNIANELLSGIDTKLVLHVSGGIRDEDKDSVKKPINFKN